MKDNALVHLQQIDALDAVDAIRAAAQSFRAQAGRWPSSLDELRRARRLPGQPDVRSGRSALRLQSGDGEGLPGAHVAAVEA